MRNEKKEFATHIKVCNFLSSVIVTNQFHLLKNVFYEKVTFLLKYSESNIVSAIMAWCSLSVLSSMQMLIFSC